MASSVGAIYVVEVVVVGSCLIEESRREISLISLTQRSFDFFANIVCIQKVAILAHETKVAIVLFFRVSETVRVSLCPSASIIIYIVV